MATAKNNTAKQATAAATTPATAAVNKQQPTAAATAQQPKKAQQVISPAAYDMLKTALLWAIGQHDKGKATQNFVTAWQQLSKVLGLKPVNGTLSPVGHKLYDAAGIPAAQVAWFEFELLKACAIGSRVNIAAVILAGLANGHAARLSNVDDSKAHLARLRAHIVCMTANNQARIVCVEKALKRVNKTAAAKLLIEANKQLLPYYDLTAAAVIAYLKKAAAEKAAAEKAAAEKAATA